MEDWERLGKYVVARRIELGYKTRTPLAEASGISTRILGDIETGRRGKFDPKTLAALENVLGWTTGSVNHVVNGSEPTYRSKPLDHTTPIVTDRRDAEDAALIRVMRSNLSTEKKKKLMALLRAEREAADRARADRADQLIELVEDEA